MSKLGNVQIDNRNGDVQLRLPDKASFKLDARTRDGEIESDFEGLNVQNNDHEAHASGTVGNASAHIVINNEHDNIGIRKGSENAIPAPPVPPSPGKPGKTLPVPNGDVEPTEN